jgi:membrane-bound lytic murein transglycosylase D
MIRKDYLSMARYTELYSKAPPRGYPGGDEEPTQAYIHSRLEQRVSPTARSAAALQHAPLTAGCLFFFAFLACFLLAGCGSGGALARPNVAYSSGPVLAASGEQAPQIVLPEGNAPNLEPKRRVQKKAYGKRSDDGAEKTVLRERDAWGPGEDYALLLRQDDANDDNIASLLTEDYLKQFDIPIVFNDAVHYFVRYFTTDKRKIFANWLRRSKRYVPMIKNILREHGLPEDLIYVAMIESGFNPRAYSSMKACGPWQFIYETGGRYGLRVNHWVDERRDPEKSTVAAALYLKDLFNQFGCWYLAAAAYNAGEKRIERSIEKHETGDFWELMKYNTLPRETREYIPRLLAAAIIAKNPEKFGFTGIDYDQPIKFVNEKIPSGTPLDVVAKAASTDMMTIRALNPEVLTGIVPPDVDDYAIKLPEWIIRDKFREELKIALEKEKKVREVMTYTLGKRDSLAGVMKKYEVDYKDLRLVNACDQELKARPGMVIYIPRFYGRAEPTEVAQETGPEKNEAAAGRESPHARQPARVNVASRADYPMVKKGESLADISGQHGVSPAMLKDLNKLKKSRIHPNMRLQLTSDVAGSGRPPQTAVYHVVKKHRTASIAGKRSPEGRTFKVIKHAKKQKTPAGAKLRASGAKAKPSTRG